jgi:septum formation protein
MTIYLASKSPRRRELFNLITKNYISVDPVVDESGFEHFTAETQTLKIAELKCKSVFNLHPDSVVVGCDTVVSMGYDVFGKPKDREDAFAMLSKFKNRTHTVYTGICIMLPGKKRSFCSSTRVIFSDIDDEALTEYVDSDETYDKAGGYGISGAASKFISMIIGDYYTVMGLPVSRLYSELRDLNVVL